MENTENAVGAQISIEQLKAWTAEMRAYKSTSWDSLPDIDLYMDQVIILMEKQLGVFVKDAGEKLITPSMINNYVKLGMLDPTVNKKYSKAHIAYLMAVCVLKQVLPISDITGLINSRRDNVKIDELYNKFNEMQDEALHSVASELSGQIDSLPEDDPGRDLNLLALKLIVTSNAYKLAAEKIVSHLKNIRSGPPAEKSEDPKVKTDKSKKPENKKADKK